MSIVKSNRRQQETVNMEWNSMAGEWDDMACGYRNRFIHLLWEETGLDSHEERVVLDFGCGTGLLTESMRKASPGSQFVCIDAASSMIRILSEKIRSAEWTNVQAYCVSLADIHGEHGEQSMGDPQVELQLKALHGKVDLVVASSVMNFVPAEDMEAIMQEIHRLLKPGGGVFCHSDWPKGDRFPDGFDDEKANQLYKLGGIKKLSTSTKSMAPAMEGTVFIGVAKRTS